MTEALDGQVSLFGPDISYSKTSPDCSVPTKDATSRQSLRSSRGSSAQTLPMFLSLQRDGQNLDASPAWVTAAYPFPSPGDYTTRSFGDQPSTLMDECGYEERHNGVSVSRLSQILEDSQHPTSCSTDLQRYYLSAKACQGILTRAKRRGKELPEELRKALEAQAGETTADLSGGGAGAETLQERLTPTTTTVREREETWSEK